YGSNIAQALGFITAAWLMYRWMERKRESKWSMGWRSSRWLLDFGWGLGLGAVLIVGITLIMGLLGVIRLSLLPAASIDWVMIGSYAGFMVLVTLNEEIIIRGYTQGLLRVHFGIWPAIVVSSLLFSLMHGLNPGALEHPIPLMSAAFAGLLLAICREASGSLWLPIGVHLSWNYVQGNILGFEVSGTEVPSIFALERFGASSFNGGDFGAEGSILTILVMIIAAAAVWHFRKMRSWTR
ncbi:MAG: Abortive infection protein, partial [Paenibacillus sp.]|nr:Abortive infection protein [Paenibacillus sp.]